VAAGAYTAAVVAEPQLDKREAEVALVAAALAAKRAVAAALVAEPAATRAEEVAGALAARDSAASQACIRALRAERLPLLPVLFRHNSGSLFGKVEPPARIGDISS
jgi:hypothetical protein